MPESFFTRKEESQMQQTGLLKDLKGKSVPDKGTKHYDFCLITPKPSTESELDSPVAKTTESEESNQIYFSEDCEEDSVVETTALKQVFKPSKSFSNNILTTDHYLTVPGTIKKGKKKEQNVEVVLNMSREELEILEANITKKKGFFCNVKNGVGFHVLLWTIFCFPFSIMVSGIYSFYIGTITWYNVFKFFSENKSLGYRILFPPLLIVLYPLLIISFSLGLGLHAGIKQISFSWDTWLKEFTDYEKGFYGWLCNFLDITECSPYEVVILSSVQKG